MSQRYYVGYYGYVGSVSKSTESPFLRNNLVTPRSLAPHTRASYGIFFHHNSSSPYYPNSYPNCRLVVDGLGGTSTGPRGGRYARYDLTHYYAIDVHSDGTTFIASETQCRSGFYLWSAGHSPIGTDSAAIILKSDESYDYAEFFKRATRLGQCHIAVANVTVYT